MSVYALRVVGDVFLWYAQYLTIAKTILVIFLP